MKELIQQFKDLKYVIIARNAFEGLGRNKTHKLSASLSYTAIFSIAPMLLLVILTAGILAEQSAIEGKVFAELNTFIGESNAALIQNLILKISFQKSNTTLATIISTIVLVIIATGLFVEVQDSLNFIWGVRPKEKKGVIKLLMSRLVSFIGIVIFGIFMAVMLLFNTLFVALSNEIIELLPWLPVGTIYWVNTAFLLVFMTLFFALLFKWLPDVNIKWKDVWGGSFITVILFLFSKWLISLYISRNTTVGLYGAAGSVVILMLWIYCSAFIFYFGAELIRAVAEYKGRLIVPKQYAELAEKRLLSDLEAKYLDLETELMEANDEISVLKATKKPLSPELAKKKHNKK